MKPIKLTANQIKHQDETVLDKLSIDKTLDIALQYHANRVNTLHKKEKKFWEELAAIHNLDLQNRQYKIVYHLGSPCITDITEENDV